MQREDLLDDAAGRQLRDCAAGTGGEAWGCCCPPPPHPRSPKYVPSQAWHGGVWGRDNGKGGLGVMEEDGGSVPNPGHGTACAPRVPLFVPLFVTPGTFWG